MQRARHISQPVGVGKLMYVGDDEVGCSRGCYSHGAVTLCKVGLAVAAVGLVTGNKTMRNMGALGALAMFIAI